MIFTDLHNALSKEQALLFPIYQKRKWVSVALSGLYLCVYCHISLYYSLQPYEL